MEMASRASITRRSPRDVQVLFVTALRAPFSKSQILEGNELSEENRGKMCLIKSRGEVVTVGNRIVFARFVVLARFLMGAVIIAMAVIIVISRLAIPVFPIAFVGSAKYMGSP